MSDTVVEDNGAGGDGTVVEEKKVDAVETSPDEAAKSEEGAGSGEVANEDGEKPKKVEWPDTAKKRVNALTQQMREKEEEIARLNQRLKEFNLDGDYTNEDEIEKRVRERMNQQSAAAQENAFKQKCNEIYTAGKGSHEDFDASLETFKLFGGIPPELINIADKLGNAHELLYHLGNDAELTAKVLGMDTVGQVIELGKLARVVKPEGGTPAKKISNAPPPAKPTVNAGGGDTGVKRLDDPTLSMEEWREIREKELAAKRAARR